MSHHVLYARLDNDGDVLLQGPALRAVAAGADRVTLLCGPRGRRAAALLPGVDDVHIFRAPWIDPEPQPVTRELTDPLVELVASLGVDQAFIATSFHQSALPLALLLRHAGVPTIAAISEDYPGSLLDVRHRDPGDVHEAERGLDLVATLGYALPDDDDGRLVIERTGERPAEVPDGEYLVVHPGASVPARAWEPEHNRALVERLADTGRHVVVTGGPDERELTAHVAGPSRPEVTDLGGATDFAELAEVVAHAAVIVVGNTGPAHLAAAVGTPVVSLFAPTVPTERWRPWMVPHELLFVDVPCAGCRARVCPVPNHPCLGDVGPAQVEAAVNRLGLVTA